jgi:hypothetical protein
MRGEAGVGRGDQAPVKPAFLDARLVARQQHDPLAVRIERVGDPPHPVVGGEPQFLHVGVLRVRQGVGVGPSQCRAFAGEDFETGEELVLYGLRQVVELRVELLGKLDLPRHRGNL